MQLTWTTLLAQYGQQHNGLFFGGNDDRFDGQLILNRGEKSPLLVMLRQVQSGRYASNQLTARTSVRLSRDYTLDIRPKGLTGSGYQTIMALAGQSRDYGCPEATKGRILHQADPQLSGAASGPGPPDRRAAADLSRRPGGRLASGGGGPEGFRLRPE